MRLSRREALRGAAGIALGAAGGEAPAWAAAATPYVEFGFTGLFAIQLWTKKPYKAGVVLVTNKDHKNPQLLIPVDDVQSTTLSSFQIILLGGEAYYLWSLVNRLIWVDDVQTSGYDQDKASTLAFTSKNDWEMARNFVQLAKACGKNTLSITKPKKVAAKLLLTRGEAFGVKPRTQAELKRYYRLCSDKDTAFKQYTSQLRIEHPLVDGKTTLTLKVAAITPGQIDRPEPIGAKVCDIVLDTSKNPKPRVGVLNSAAGQAANHFHEFIDMVGEKKTGLQFTEGTPNPDDKCTDGPHGAPDSPYVGCIPPIISQDA